MKYFISLLAFLFLISSQQKKTLRGVYKLEYKNTSLMQNGTIVFEDSVYTMQNVGTIKTTGIIKYGKNLTLLDGNFHPNIVIDFSYEDIEKDTISFQVHNKKGGVVNYLDVSVNSGKLIKIRN